MTVFIPGRLVRLAFFTVAAAGAGLHSAEATATTLCILAMYAACCRSPRRLELVFSAVAAFAARYSGGDLATFKAGFLWLLPVVIAFGGLYAIGHFAFGSRGHRDESWRGRRSWRHY
ncbi:MAG: hypothetical protein HY735_03520 [Verrucomicrobia bacterium]|nr:hypothetical protein [Verrucomicrobiota bacterium]